MPDYPLRDAKPANDGNLYPYNSKIRPPPYWIDEAGIEIADQPKLVTSDPHYWPYTAQRPAVCAATTADQSAPGGGQWPQWRLVTCTSKGVCSSTYRSTTPQACLGWRVRTKSGPVKIPMRPSSQPAGRRRALFGTRGRTFKSCHSDQYLAAFCSRPAQMQRSRCPCAGASFMKSKYRVCRVPDC